MRLQYRLPCALVALIFAACSGSGSNPGGPGSDGGSSSSSGSSSGSSGSGSGGSSSSGSSSGGGSGSSSGSSSGGGSGSSSGSSSGGHDGGACGTCPTGFSCNAAGTYCVTSDGVPAFDHVFLIVMENTSQSAINATNAPYITGLTTQYAYTTNYSTQYHPSLPNYLDIISGTNQGTTSDGTPATIGPFTAKHLGDQLDAASLTWRMYAESAGGPCVLKDNGTYATKHVPFLFFTDIAGTAATCQDRVVDYSEFATDLVAPRRFSMISPNLCDDMHGGATGCLIGSITTGDTWLKTNAGAIIAKLGPTDVLFIVWDEETGSTGTAPILFIPTGPLVKTGATSSKAYTHESLLRTIEEGFGITTYLANAGQVPSAINDVWK